MASPRLTPTQSYTERPREKFPHVPQILYLLSDGRSTELTYFCKTRQISALISVSVGYAAPSWRRARTSDLTLAP
jgi:hypothetical protein